MGSSARRWAMGCGCGCGVFALLLGAGGYFLITSIVREVAKAEEVMGRVREEQGRIADFQPDPDGLLRAERMEAFLRARKLMATTRTETEGALGLLSSQGSTVETQVPGMLGQLLEWGLGAMKIDAARGLLPQVIGFGSARGEALLEAGMGVGEYLYIYSLAYFSWLGESPADGPSFPLLGDDEDRGQQGQSEWDEFDVREGRREAVLTHLHDLLLPMLRRQLAALDERSDVLESDPWRQQLAAEIAAMEEDRFRIPWRDGLPAPIETSLRPFRGRLKSSYSPECNPLEVLTGTGEWADTPTSAEEVGP